MIEEILSEKNLNKAINKILKGSENKEKRNSNVNCKAGYDEVSIYKFREIWKEEKFSTINMIKIGNYYPDYILRKYIPKTDGQKRPLGIPIVKDRVIQQAFNQVLSPIYEKLFNNNSFGFRPNRSCEMAVNKLIEYFKEGYRCCISIDIEKFFNNVNHDILIDLLKKDINDPIVINNIKNMLKAKVIENYQIYDNEIGTPQGGNISPLLANIYLNVLDKYITDKSYKFVRYADDVIIVSNTKSKASKILTEISDYLYDALKLNVNKTKSYITYPEELKYLGFTFKLIEGEYKLYTPENKIDGMKFKLYKILDRSNFYMNGIDNSINEINDKYIGFINYYKNSINIIEIAKEFDKFININLRLNLLKNIKDKDRKKKMLKYIGLSDEAINRIIIGNKRYFFSLCEEELKKIPTKEFIIIGNLKLGTTFLFRKQLEITHREL